MSYMPVTDALFLLAESREHPFHVGGLQLFTPPDDADPDYVARMVDELRSRTDVDRRFRQRPADPVSSMGTVWWTDDGALDFEYHVRHSALPRPGRIRELLQMTSLWHGTPLDRHRPMWEMHLVEGIEGGRFAIYTKLHHSLFDGVSALRLLERTLSDDPDDREMRAPWQLGKRQSDAVAPPKRRPWGPLGLVNDAISLGGTAVGLLPASVKVVNQALRDHSFTTPFEAPRSILNQPIGGSRRFVAQSWEIDRVRTVAEAAGATLNDVVLAMCSGGLARYLGENNALPERSLTAMVPVSLRADDADGSEGNQIGAVIASLATDVEDPMDRLAAIQESVQSSKRLMRDLSPAQILLLSALNISPLALSPLPGYVSVAPPPFNLIISNVPGPQVRKYWNGARMDGIYPASVVLDGQAMSITLTSNADKLDFGIIGCRQTLPSLQRMIHHLEDALTELEKAAAA